MCLIVHGQLSLFFLNKWPFNTKDASLFSDIIYSNTSFQIVYSKENYKKLQKILAEVFIQPKTQKRVATVTMNVPGNDTYFCQSVITGDVPCDVTYFYIRGRYQ